MTFGAQIRLYVARDFRSYNDSLKPYEEFDCKVVPVETLRPRLVIMVKFLIKSKLYIDLKRISRATKPTMKT